MVDVREYLDPEGNSPFAVWFDDLNAPAAAKVTTAVTRLEQGNYSNVKGVGSGVLEYKIDFGPGYRIYFGKDGICLVILLGGGTKKRQDADISLAIARWQDYKQRRNVAPTLRSAHKEGDR
jgi:putative addiction module killer protein